MASSRLARDVVKKIEEQLQYPGQIKVTVIRDAVMAAMLLPSTSFSCMCNFLDGRQPQRRRPQLPVRRSPVRQRRRRPDSVRDADELRGGNNGARLTDHDVLLLTSKVSCSTSTKTATYRPATP